MKTLIIDDERLARKELLSLLDSYPELEIVGEAVNAEDAYEKIQSMKPELIFLDIQMPGKTGFELLEMLDSAPKVIFTTAYDEFAIK
ncbi:MAG: response regulator, partial [Cyclobacteriaceae bacterium]